MFNETKFVIRKKEFCKNVRVSNWKYDANLRNSISQFDFGTSLIMS